MAKVLNQTLMIGVLNNATNQQKQKFLSQLDASLNKQLYHLQVKTNCNTFLMYFVSNQMKTPSPKKPSRRPVHHKADFIVPGYDDGYDEVDEKENYPRNDKYNAREGKIAPPPEVSRKP